MGGPFLSQPCRGYWVLFLLLSQDVVLDAVVPTTTTTIFSIWKLGQICLFNSHPHLSKQLPNNRFLNICFFSFYKESDEHRYLTVYMLLRICDEPFLPGWGSPHTAQAASSRPCTEG